MAFVDTLLVAAILALPKQTPGVVTSSSPQWVDFGLEGGHRVWARIQHRPDAGDLTLFEFYSDGHRVKSKSIESDFYFLSSVRPAVASVNGRWFLFYDEAPGAGSTWFTNYLVIRKRDLSFERLAQFEHGDASGFQATRHFFEYKLLKYEGDRRFRKLGVTGFEVIDWHWSAKLNRFRRRRHWYTPYAPRHVDKHWDASVDGKLHGDLVGFADYFRPADCGKYGLPNDSHLLIAPFKGFGDWTIGLVRGRMTTDELNLVHGLTDLAGLDYTIGEVDNHNPPRLCRSSHGLVLSLTTYAFHQVRVSKFLIQTKPYKISLLGSWLKPEWTPFAVR